MTDSTDSLKDIKPKTPVSSLDRRKYSEVNTEFPIDQVAKIVGMSRTFIHKICGRKSKLSASNVLNLLDQDAFSETLVPRSQAIEYLLSQHTPQSSKNTSPVKIPESYTLLHGSALNYLSCIPAGMVQCVVTSTPYWGLRIYNQSSCETWADGEICAYGHEQTPEGFIRHTTQILASLYDVLTETGSIWWNIMDTFNTRTQIRNNAAEALHAMQGKDTRGWRDHTCRRYSAGHSYLKDGEQCLIPTRIAERASRLGYYVKSVITWSKTSTLPEPQNSRVSRNLEYVLHLSKQRTPKFDKTVYRTLPAELGGRNNGWESDKLSDVWSLPTSSGRDGHGAQFPIALPGRCIALSSKPGELVLDPFVGAGTSGIAARALNRRFIGIDVSQEYLSTAQRKISAVQHDARHIS